MDFVVSQILTGLSLSSILLLVALGLAIIYGVTGVINLAHGEFVMLGAYCAAKAGVILLTQTMALELGSSGIRVNAVCPGTVDTDLINPNGMMATMLGGDSGLQAFIDREIPLGRLQSAEEIAASLCWLLSDDARGVTGEALNVSAGQTMV